MAEQTRQDRGAIARAGEAGPGARGACTDDTRPHAGDFPEDEIFADPFDRPEESAR